MTNEVGFSLGPKGLGTLILYGREASQISKDCRGVHLCQIGKDAPKHDRRQHAPVRANAFCIAARIFSSVQAPRGRSPCPASNSRHKKCQAPESQIRPPSQPDGEAFRACQRNIPAYGSPYSHQAKQGTCRCSTSVCARALGTKKVLTPITHNAATTSLSASDMSFLPPIPRPAL
jgi:hypothetical protein